MEMCFICRKNPSTTQIDCSILLSVTLKLPKNLRDQLRMCGNPQGQLVCKSCTEIMQGIRNDFIQMRQIESDLQSKTELLEQMFLDSSVDNTWADGTRNQITLLVSKRKEILAREEEIMTIPERNDKVEQLGIQHLPEIPEIDEGKCVTATDSSDEQDKFENISMSKPLAEIEDPVDSFPADINTAINETSAVAPEDSNTNYSDTSMEMGTAIDEIDLDIGEIKIENVDEWDLSENLDLDDAGRNWKLENSENKEELDQAKSSISTSVVDMDGTNSKVSGVSTLLAPIKKEPKDVEDPPEYPATSFESGSSQRRFKTFSQLLNHHKRLNVVQRRTGALGKKKWQLRSADKVTKKRAKRSKK